MYFLPGLGKICCKTTLQRKQIDISNIILPAVSKLTEIHNVSKNKHNDL